MKDKVPEFMIPSRFVALDTFPLTPNRKIDRKALPPPGQIQMESKIPYAPPKSELEQAIANIWQEVLNVSKIGLNDNFFDLGGHSLLIVRALNLLLEKVDAKPSITDMFRFPTIQTLAEYLRKDSGDGAEPSMQKSAVRAKARREAIVRRRKSRQRPE